MRIVFDHHKFSLVPTLVRYVLGVLSVSEISKLVYTNKMETKYEICTGTKSPLLKWGEKYQIAADANTTCIYINIYIIQNTKEIKWV